MHEIWCVDAYSCSIFFSLILMDIDDIVYFNANTKILNNETVSLFVAGKVDLNMAIAC